MKQILRFCQKLFKKQLTRAAADIATQHNAVNLISDANKQALKKPAMRKLLLQQFFLQIFSPFIHSQRCVFHAIRLYMYRH
jgi:hypothetical protein